MGELGSLYLTGSRQSFWNREGVSESLQAGFSSSLGPASYNLSVSHSRTAGFVETDRSVWLSVSLPLGQWLPGNDSQTYATFSGSRDSRGDIAQQAGLSGSLLEERNLNWNLTQGQSQKSGNSSGVRLDYRGSYANTNVGYSRSNNYRQLSYGAAGGVIVHQDGLTLSQPLGDTNILVAAPGASGVALENGTGIRTDWRGYTVRPWASGYRENRVALDTSTLDDRTEIDGAVARVVPTRGALVRADFRTRSGVRALLTLVNNGTPLPFGTVVSGDGSSGIVSDDGQVYLAGLPPEGVLKAQWGNEADQQCTVKYRIPAAGQKVPLAQLQAVCR